MIKCKTCGVESAIPSYMLARYDYRCRQCANAEKAAWMRAHRAKLAAAGVPLKRRKPGKRWFPQTETSKQKIKEQHRRAYLKKKADPVQHTKMKARYSLRRAVCQRRITKHPCEVCGAPRVEAHHENYSLPLDVRWLCSRHHREVHHADKNQQAAH